MEKPPGDPPENEFGQAASGPTADPTIADPTVADPTVADQTSDGASDSASDAESTASTISKTSSSTASEEPSADEDQENAQTPNAENTKQDTEDALELAKLPKLSDKEVLSLRLHSRQRLRLSLQSIYDRYGRNLEAVSDVVDLYHERVSVNNGDLRSRKRRVFGKTWQGLEGRVVENALLRAWGQGELAVIENVDQRQLEIRWPLPEAEVAEPPAEQLSDWSAFGAMLQASNERLCALAGSIAAATVAGDAPSGPEDNGDIGVPFDDSVSPTDLTAAQQQDVLRRVLAPAGDLSGDSAPISGALLSPGRGLKRRALDNGPAD